MEKKESAAKKLKRRLNKRESYSENLAVQPAPSTKTKGSEPGINPVSCKGYDKELIVRAIEAALKNPRIGAWSPRSAIILNYIKFTRPLGGTSLSSEIDEILTRGLISRYPELNESIEEVMDEKQIEMPKKRGKK